MSTATQTFEDLLLGQSAKFHVLGLQLIAIPGAGKTNSCAYLAEYVYSDYEVVYVQAPSLWELIRIIYDMGIEGKTKYLVIIDDPSFLIHNVASDARETKNIWRKFQNKMTRIRHIVATKAKVDAGDVRIVLIWAHHYVKSIGPYLRDSCQIHMLGSLTSKGDMHALKDIFDTEELKRFLRVYDNFIFSPDSDLDRKTFAPFLLKVHTRHYAIALYKSSMSLEAFRRNQVDDTYQQPIDVKDDPAKIVLPYLVAYQNRRVLTYADITELGISSTQIPKVKEEVLKALQDKPELEEKIEKDNELNYTVRMMMMKQGLSFAQTKEILLKLATSKTLYHELWKLGIELNEKELETDIETEEEDDPLE